jgi:hypothetical protein
MKSSQEEKNMNVTEKQVNALQKFAKNKELSDGILKDVKFDQLTKEKASELIDKCIKMANGNKNESSGLDLSKISYSHNYKNGNGSFSTAKLSDEELEKVREAHLRHCKEILQECEEGYPNDRELQLAIFEKRADKVFTWIERALDEKVRHQRK